MFQHQPHAPTPWHPLNTNHWRVAVEVPAGYKRCSVFIEGRQCTHVFKADGKRLSCAKCRVEKRKATIFRRCPECEKTFEAKHSGAKYCSKPCANAAQRGRGANNRKATRDAYSAGWHVMVTNGR